MKKYILYFFIFSSPLRLKAYSIDTFFVDPTPLYLKHYYSRMHEWYFENFFFSQNKTNKDLDEIQLLKYVEQSISAWAVSINDKNFLNIQFIHSVEGANYNHQIFQISVNVNDQKQKNIISKIFNKNKIPHNLLASIKFLKVDLLNKSIEVQTVENMQNIKTHIRLVNLVKKIAPQKYKEFVITHHVYKNGKEIDMGITFFPLNFIEENLKKYPFYPAIMDIRKRLYLSGKEEEELELRAFNLIYLSPEGQRFSILHEREFAQLAHKMIWNSKDNYSIYYP